jgi:CRP-like cAMP-binding protein
MKLVPDLRRFINFNLIDDDAIRAAAGYIYYKHFNKGEYICYEGEDSNCFFGIITGKVSIRRRKMILPEVYYIG